MAGEASESSVSSGCQAKTELHSEVALTVICGGGETETCVTDRKTSIQGFFVTAAPRELYFASNPRIMKTMSGF